MNDVAYFVAWCIEQYKVKVGLDGAAAMELLDQQGVLQYLADNYEVLHTQSPQWLMEEIDERLNSTREEVSL